MPHTNTVADILREHWGVVIRPRCYGEEQVTQLITTIVPSQDDTYPELAWSQLGIALLERTSDWRKMRSAIKQRLPIMRVLPMSQIASVAAIELLAHKWNQGVDAGMPALTSSLAADIVSRDLDLLDVLESSPSPYQQALLSLRAQLLFNNLHVTKEGLAQVHGLMDVATKHFLKTRPNDLPQLVEAVSTAAFFLLRQESPVLLRASLIYPIIPLILHYGKEN